MKCNQCDLPRYWTGQRENNKLVYACENGHPNLVDIPTIEEMCGFIPDMTEGQRCEAMYSVFKEKTNER